MAKKTGYDYKVKRIDEDETEQRETEETPPELSPMPMAEVNSGGIAVAFFILICAAGFVVFLLRRACSGAGLGTVIGCLVLAAIVVGAVLGIFATSVAKYRRSEHPRWAVLVTIFYLLAVFIGAVVGLKMPIALFLA